MLAGSGHFW
jgi:hypothetical protein